MIFQSIRSVLLVIGLVASAALAADVGPMYFEGVDDTLQQKYWDNLMTFKAWGTNGISIGRGSMPDTSGAIGTAKGNIYLEADGIVLGGKTLVGGDLIFGAGTGKLIKGPVRTTGNFTSGTNGFSEYQGTYCIEGATDYGAKLGITNAGGTRREGEVDAKSGICSYELVSEVPTSLKVPLIKDSESLYDAGGTIDVSGSNNVFYIDVPRINEGEGKLWDLYYQSINIHDGGELRIRMPANGGGRLVRIFLNHTINFNAGAKLRVEYVNEGAVYSNGQWTNVNDSSKILTNEEYAGNLLIYMKDDVTWAAFNKDDRIQGSLITQGVMEIKSNLHLAGQLIAEKLKIAYEFDGSGFRYVPFDPAVLDPELFSVRDFEESGISTEVPVRLDTNTITDVYFDYCFELTKEEPVNGKTSSQKADITDFDFIPHLCDEDTGRVTILAGSKFPTKDSKIFITVKLDSYKEMYGTSLKEGFKLRVFNMVGAVLKDNAQEGYFDLNIIDRNIYPETRDTTFAVAEDDTIRFNAEMFPYYSLTDVAMTGVRIEQLPNANRGTMTYKGKAVAKNQVIPVDSLEYLIFVPAENYYDAADETVLTTVKFAVVDANNAISSLDKTSTGDLVGNKEMVITVNAVNDPPVAESATFSTAGHSIPGGTALKGSISVKDLDDTVFTYAFDKSDKNFALVDSLFVIDETTGVISVKDGITLKRLTNDSLFTIGVVVSDKSASTGKEEDILSTVSEVTIKINYGYNPPAVDIVEGGNTGGKWPDPTIIKTNIPNMTLTCTYNGGKDKEVCVQDTTLVEGCRYYAVSYWDDDHDGIAYDSVQICLSTATPFVSVETNKKKVVADNIYTIVEEVDVDDPRTYVNGITNEIHIVVNDSAAGVKKDYVIALDLDTTGVPKNSLAEMTAVIKANIALDEMMPTKIVSLNGDAVLHSYKVAYKGGDSVTVSYKTDKDGDLVKVPVTNSEGKIDSIEVYTITYVTTINGREVSISYTADAVTGAVLMVDSDGSLMTEGAASKKGVNAVPYTVSYDFVDSKGNSVNISYGVDENGNPVKNEAGDIGYQVSFSYVNEYGNSASKSVTVVLDRVGPSVVIISPEDASKIRANFVDVKWEVNGVEQDTLNLQSLEKGLNTIVRVYKDKAGNVSTATVRVFMKDAKAVSVSEEQPVTIVTKDKVDEYYASNPPEKGQNYAVSIRNPKTGKEVETLKGGAFGRKAGSGKAPYPGLEEENHLGPALVMEIKLPVVNAVGGLATLDDLMDASGNVSIDGLNASNSRKMPMSEYVKTYCEDDFSFENASMANLYKIKSNVKIWIYTTLGNFVEHYSFSQELNDPSFTDDVGMLQMFFEQKPDLDGNVRDKSGRLLATGAYLYKVEVNMKSELRCTLPPVKDEKGKKKGDVLRTSDNLLRPFGYMRPEK